MNAREILARTAPGTMTVVEGRPGSGVSTTTSAVCRAAVESGLRAAFVCGERPVKAAERLTGESVVCIDSLGLSLDGICQAVIDQRIEEGDLVALDYLQLVPDLNEEDLADVAIRMGWRIVVGVAASRKAADSLTIR